jgi:DNA mismatch repair protein MutL
VEAAGGGGGRVVSRIRALPEEIANRIAAGEVVERPASLVKELVENSLDAGARRVDVSFEGGGLELVRVADDGSGIAPEDVRLAFERHATSKVATAEDLDAIATLGFRGEALASIAAVSRVTLVTCPAGGPAARIVLEGGRVLEEGRGARAEGTTIEVRGLFYNTPARKAFLRTPGTEGRLLVRMLAQLALGATGVAFRVHRDGRSVLEIAAADDFRARVGAILGADTADRMLPVRGGRGGVRIEGLVSVADFARTKVDHQVLLVNARPVVDPAISHAVTAGLGGAVPHGKFAVFALALDVDPSEVDVNVHPAKREVRFRRKDLVYAAVREAVAAAVVDVAFDRLGRAGALPWREGRGPAALGRVRESAMPPAAGGTTGPLRRSVASGYVAPRFADAPSASGPVLLATRRLRLAGELWGAYLLVEDRDRLLVIDQHAAHERVLYDEIRRGPGREQAVQGLLVPLAVDLAPGTDPEEVCAALAGVGFDARPGGPSSLLVHGVPAHLSRWGGGEFLRELFASPEGALSSVEAFGDALAKSYSCRGAVKFGQRLHPDEVAHLLAGLERADVPRLCPHGRPIYLEVPRASLDDRFER